MPRPDIVFLHCHDLGRHLALYGEAGPRAPALERLAEEGVLFEGLYSTSTLCSPSRGSIQTGLYPHQIGLFGLCNRAGWDLTPGIRCIPHYLEEAGYRTTLLGLQHETTDWHNLGYGERVPLPARHPAPAHLVAQQTADLIADLPPRDQREPVYLNIGIFEPHRHDYWDEYAAGDPSAVRVPGFLPDTPAVRQDLARYEGLIGAMDDAVGMVLTALDKAGMTRDTLVLFTTDHGIAFPRAKTTVYDAGIGVTGMARWPAAIRGGRRTDTLLSHVDWLPTLLDSVGIRIPRRVAGRSFWPLLAEERRVARSFIFGEGTYQSAYSPSRCVRSQGYKLIRNYHSQPTRYRSSAEDRFNGILGVEDYASETWLKRPLWELYDLQADPYERDNRIDDPGLAMTRRQLEEELTTWLVRTHDPVYQMYATYHYPEGADTAPADPGALVSWGLD